MDSVFYRNIFGSGICIIFTTYLCQIFRTFLDSKLKNQSKITGIRRVLHEFVAAFELTTVAYETSIVFETGGVGAYAMFIFLVCFWRMFYWKDITANPCNYVVEWALTNSLDTFSLILTIIGQLTGAFIAYNYYSAIYWKLGLLEAHLARLDTDATTVCTSFIQATPFVATIVEASGQAFLAFAFTVLFRFTDEAMFQTVFPALITLCVVLGLFTSGGFYNPILASAMQYGCAGSTLLEHIQVYWVGNTIGAFAGHYISQLLPDSTPKLRPRKQLKKTK